MKPTVLVITALRVFACLYPLCGQQPSDPPDPAGSAAGVNSRVVG